MLMHNLFSCWFKKIFCFACCWVLCLGKRFLVGQHVFFSDKRNRPGYDFISLKDEIIFE